MKVTLENGRISVVSAYNRAWVLRAKELGGRWDASDTAWVFPDTSEELVRDALLDIYGEDGRPGEKVTVDIELDEETYIDDELIIAGMIVLQRFGRDTAVACKNGAIIVSGGFDKSGGSVRNPRIGTPHSGTVVRVEIPKVKLAELSAEGYKYTEVHTEVVDRKALEAEKAALLKRLAEIEKLLG